MFNLQNSRSGTLEEGRCEEAGWVSQGKIWGDRHQPAGKEEPRKKRAIKGNVHILIQFSSKSKEEYYQLDCLFRSLFLNLQLIIKWRLRILKASKNILGRDATKINIKGFMSQSAVTPTKSYWGSSWLINLTPKGYYSFLTSKNVSPSLSPRLYPLVLWVSVGTEAAAAFDFQELIDDGLSKQAEVTNKIDSNGCLGCCYCTAVDNKPREEQLMNISRSR